MCLCGGAGSGLRLALLLGLDALRSMGYTQQTLLGDKFACGLADAVGLVLDTHQRHLKIADELQLMGCQTPALLREGCGTLFEDLERGRGILRVVVARMCYGGAQQLVVSTSLFEFLSIICLNSARSASPYLYSLLCHSGYKVIRLLRKDSLFFVNGQIFHIKR